MKNVGNRLYGGMNEALYVMGALASGLSLSPALYSLSQGDHYSALEFGLLSCLIGLKT